MGVSADEVETEAGAKKAFGGAEYRDGLALVEAFLHYPLDMMPRNPGELLPRGWEARTRRLLLLPQRLGGAGRYRRPGLRQAGRAMRLEPG